MSRNRLSNAVLNIFFVCNRYALSTKNEIPLYFVFSTSFKDKGYRVYEYDNK